MTSISIHHIKSVRIGLPTRVVGHDDDSEFGRIAYCVRKMEIQTDCDIFHIDLFAEDTKSLFTVSELQSIEREENA